MCCPGTQTFSYGPGLHTAFLRGKFQAIFQTSFIIYKLPQRSQEYIWGCAHPKNYL